MVRLVAMMPRPLIYFHADLLYLLLYHIAGYRRKVVDQNLRRAFPGHSKKELSAIRRKFYLHLADLIIESAVIQYFPKKRLQKMFVLKDPGLYNRFFEEGRHVIIMAGHYNNWEWASPMSYTVKHQVLAVYKPLHNKYFEKSISRSRIRFGAIATPMANIARVMYDLNNKGIPTLTGMIADQRPQKKNIHYWTHLLDQKTAMYTGTEKLAMKFNAVVLFMKVRKIKRGRYTGESIIISENPRETEEFEITEKFTRALEDLIREKPEYWLWSHNRWKLSYDKWLEQKGK